MKVLKRTAWLYHWECDGKIYEIRTDEKAAAIAKAKEWTIDYGTKPPIKAQ
jgi:hypothetical protein